MSASIGVSSLQTHLGDVMQQLEKGATFTITRYGKAVAQIESFDPKTHEYLLSEPAGRLPRKIRRDPR